MHYTYNADGEKIMVSEDPVISLGLNAAGTATVTTSGALMATITGGSVQPYKYNGKINIG